MKITKVLTVVAAVGLWAALGAATTYAQASATPDPKIEKKKTEVRKMADDTLKRLFKVQPAAKGAIERSAGYAVFSNTGVKILVSGTGKGQGIAVSKITRQETFMKMFELQAGLGIGVKKFKVIFVFDNEKAFNKFVNSGWEFGAQSDDALKAGDGKGGSVAGAASVSDGVWMYQLTDKGLALEITAKSTKYSKDDELNK